MGGPPKGEFRQPLGRTTFVPYLFILKILATWKTEVPPKCGGHPPYNFEKNQPTGIDNFADPMGLARAFQCRQQFFDLDIRRNLAFFLGLAEFTLESLHRRSARQPGDRAHLVDE